MENDEIESFLCELYCMISDKKKEFFNGDENLYVYLKDNLNEYLEISIDGNYFNNINKAIDYLKINKNYKHVITLNNGLDLEEEEEIIKKVYDLLLDEEQTKKEYLNEITKTLTDEYLDYNKEIDDDYIYSCYEYLEYTEDCEIYERFIEDEEFAKELLENYFETRDFNNLNSCVFDIDVEELENSINPSNNNGDITLVNKMYENIISDIYNYFCKNSINDDIAIEFLISYFSDEVLLNKNFYKKYFGDTNINITNIVTIQKLLIISNYYKYNSPYIDDLDNITEFDNRLLKFIRNSSINKIIDKFNKEMYFQERCISEFINNSNYKSNNYYSKNKDVKTLQKINPFYYIDEITKE